MNYKTLLLVCIIVAAMLGVNSPTCHAQMSAFKIARLKYGGGGDWYNDQSSEVNLLKYIRANTNILVQPIFEFVEASSDNIYQYPMIFVTGHGNIKFTEQEVRKLRAYLENGGFLYIDDDYGFDAAIRREMQRVFPELSFVELPYSHPIFSIQYPFPNGAPKIHEHDGKPPQTFGMFYGGRLCVLYTYESNPSDGWADPDVHNNPPEKREQALRFGTNLVVWVLSQKQ